MTAFRCFFPAWIGAWFVAIFLPSAIIAYLGLSEATAAIGTGFDRLPAAAWKVADDVGPVVKLVIGAQLLIGFLALDRRSGYSPGARYAAAVGIGLAAMVIAIAFIPAGLSRGFAAALTGTRFDISITPLYLFGGALAGVVFVQSSDRCRRGASRHPSGAANR